MKEVELQKILFWAPRLLGLTGVCRLSILCLALPERGASPLEMSAIQLLSLFRPASLLLAVLVAWRWPWFGGLFFMLAASYVLGTAPHPRLWNLTVAAPLFLLGLLFLIGWLVRSAVALCRGFHTCELCDSACGRWPGVLPDLGRHGRLSAMGKFACPAAAEMRRLPFLPQQVGSHWSATEQIDVVAVNWDEAEVLYGECK